MSQLGLPVLSGTSVVNTLPDRLLTDGSGHLQVVLSGSVVPSVIDAADGLTGSPVPLYAGYNGGIVATSYPTALTNGQLAGMMTDKAGRQITVLNAPRDLIGTASLDSSSGSAVSFIAAGASGVFNDIVSLVITNDSSTATIVTLSDNGSGGNTYRFALAGNGGMVFNPPTPLPQGTAAAAWDVLNSAAVSCHYIAIFCKNK